MSLNLIFTTKKNSKTIITDSESGACLYEVELKKGHITRIYKGSQLLAEIRQDKMSSTHSGVIVYYKGKTTAISEFCKERDGKRVFVASDDKQYAWKIEEFWNGQFKVAPVHDKSEPSPQKPEDLPLVAKSHKQHFGIFCKARKLRIEILSSGLPIRDDILVAFYVASFLKDKTKEILEKREKQKRQDTQKRREAYQLEKSIEIFQVWEQYQIRQDQFQQTLQPPDCSHRHHRHHPG